VVVAVGLAAAGMFEFNFGDTEVFWIMARLFSRSVYRLRRGSRGWGVGRGS